MTTLEAQLIKLLTAQSGQSEQLTSQIQLLAKQNIAQAKQIEQLSEQLEKEIQTREDFTRDLTGWATSVGKSIKALSK